MPRKKIYENAAARVAAYRERNGTVQLCVDMPKDLMEAFETFLKFKNLTKKDVLHKLITTQLVRKR